MTPAPTANIAINSTAAATEAPHFQNLLFSIVRADNLK
jgi:hypothetical protein